MMMCSGAGGSSCSTGTSGGSSTSNSGSGSGTCNTGTCNGYGTHALPPTGNCVKVTRVWIEDTLTLYMGNEYCMEANVYPVTATEQGVRWNSSCTDVATISSSGKIKAKKEGNTTITVITKDGNFSKNCVVVVEKPPVKGSGNSSCGSSSCCGYGCDGDSYEKPSNILVSCVEINKPSLTIKVDETHQLSAKVYPLNANDKRIKWSSSNDKILEICENGMIFAKMAGEAVITVTTVDGRKTAQCYIRILPLREMKYGSII